MSNSTTLQEATAVIQRFGQYLEYPYIYPNKGYCSLVLRRVPSDKELIGASITYFPEIKRMDIDLVVGSVTCFSARIFRSDAPAFFDFIDAKDKDMKEKYRQGQLQEQERVRQKQMREEEQAAAHIRKLLR